MSGDDVARVLPRPRKAAVIEEDVALLELAQDALLLVLLDGRGALGRRDLELFLVHLGISHMKKLKSCVEGVFVLNGSPSTPEHADATSVDSTQRTSLGHERDVVPQTQLRTVILLALGEDVDAVVLGACVALRRWRASTA